MKLYLSKVQIRTLSLLCSRSFTAGELAIELGVKPSFVSRLLKSLAELGLVMVQKQGASKEISLSAAGHSQAFKKLYQSRPKAGIEQWLSGHAISLLIPILDVEGGLNRRELLREAGCSYSTLLKTMKGLGAVGAAGKVNGKYVIHDALVRLFVSEFANNVQLIMQKQLVGYNVSIRMGKHVVVRTETKDPGEEFAKTGVNKLVEVGLEAMLTSYNDYYFSLDGKTHKISTEEAFVHALLLSTLRYNVDFTVLASFLNKNKQKLDWIQLRKYAKMYKVENALREMQRSLELYEKLRG